MILNDVGLELSEMEEVTALTDVTGFGLMGHLLEVCEGSNVSAIINYSKVPVFKGFMTISIKMRPWSYTETGTVMVTKLENENKSKDISYVIHKLVADY
jgi:selenophosphate synthase